MLGNSLGYMATSCLILLLGGCSVQAGSSAAAASMSAPAVLRREDYSVDLPEGRPGSENKAVLALLEQSRAQQGGGELDKAAASLERALHIEPRNAFLYSKLAALRLQQERYDETVALAAKSNSLGRRDARLQLANWQMIAAARKAQSDDDGAAHAEQRAAQLREFINQ